MQPKTFPSLVYSSFAAVHGYVFGIIGLALSVVLFAITSDCKILIASVTFVFAILLLACVTFAHAAFLAWSDRRPRLPTVISVQSAPPPYPAKNALFLLSEKPLFLRDTEAAVYSMEDNVELLIGIGRVVDVQSDECVQLLVAPLKEDYWDRISKNNKDARDRLVIKPGVPEIAKAFAKESS